jgi:HEAT repeat protein
MGLFDGLFKPDLKKLERDKDVRGLIKALRDEKDSFWAASALSRIGISSVEPLIAVLKDPDRNVRYHAIMALEMIGDTRAVYPLIAALRDTEYEVRKKVTITLGKMGDTRAVEPLIAALRDSSDYDRQDAAIALGEMGDSKAVEPLIAALSDPDYKVRQSAIIALGKIRDSKAVEPLIAALEKYPADYDGHIFYYDHPIKFDNSLNCVVEALGEIGDPRAVERLIAILKGPEKVHPYFESATEFMSRDAAEALVKIGSPSIEPLCAVVMDSKKGDVHELAAEALRKIWAKNREDNE